VNAAPPRPAAGAAPAPEAGWASRPERSNMAALRCMSWISLRLGRAPGRLVLGLVSAYFLIFSPAARRASRDYLARIFGRPPRLVEQARHFFSFAATVHDRIYLLNDRLASFDIDVEGEEVVREAVESGRGALLFGAHLGSFEVIRSIGRRHPGLRLALTMYEDNARRINQVLAAINPAAAPEIIPLGRIDTMLRVRDALAAGSLVGLLADRTLGDKPTQRVSLLGAPAALPVGPFRMAAMLRQPVIFMAGLYLGGNRYRIRFQRLADFRAVAPPGREAAIAEAIKRYAANLDACCRQAPYNWFNFFDFWLPEAERPA
jgi:predicted LPLAT superfamily acyltransferase